MSNTPRHHRSGRVPPGATNGGSRIALTGLVLIAAINPSAEASPVTVDGTFNTFTSWIVAPSLRESLVNGTALTSTGVILGNNGAYNFYRSNTVTFSNPTTRLDFVYGAPFPNPLANAFEFIPAPAADVVMGQEFQLGTLRFTNGQWYPEADIDFTLTTRSPFDPALDGHTFYGTLRLISNVDLTVPLTPEEEADFFYVVQRLDAGPLDYLGGAYVYDSFRQPAGNPGFVGEFALMGEIGSLNLTRFVALNDAAFTDPSTEAHTGTIPGPVPLPATWLLLATGLGAVAAAKRRNST